MVQPAFKKTQNKGKNSGRVLYPKEDYCLFCEELLSNIHRHYEIRHGGEEHVKEMMKAKKNFKKNPSPTNKDEKDRQQTLLKNRGNFKHNLKVLAANSGELHVVRRPESPLDAVHFTPCPDCFGFYNKRDLFKHQCLLKGSGERHLLRRGQNLLDEALNKELVRDINSIAAKVREDVIRQIILSDEVIMGYTKSLMSRHSFSHNNQDDYIRARARDLAKLLLTIRKVQGDPTLSLLGVLKDPINYDILEKSVLELSKNVLELPRRLGTAIRKCLIIVQVKGMKTSDEDLISKARLFDNLMTTVWADNVTSQSLKRQKAAKLKKRVSIINYYYC